MGGLAAFLIILVILFGVEAVREMAAGVFNFFLVIIIIFLILGFIGWLFGDNRTPAQRKIDEEAAQKREREQKEQLEKRAKEIAEKKAEEKHEFWNKTFPLLMVVFLFLVLAFLAAISMKK